MLLALLFLFNTFFSLRTCYLYDDSKSNLFLDFATGTHLSSSWNYIMKVRFKIGESRQYPIVKWENFLAGDWTDLYLEYTKNNFNITVGRWNKKWGYSDRYSLILNDTIPARDGIYFKYKMSSAFQFDYFISNEGAYTLQKSFNTRLGDSLAKGTVINRTLIGHKLELNVPNFAIYFAEVAYCPSIGYLPNPKYLNPLFIYFLLQFNNAQQNDGIGVDANILWDFGIKVELENIKFYSQLLVDDFQYVGISTREPPQIGGLIGIKYSKSGWNINTEYTRVWAWTYLHENPWENYETMGYSLGHPYGPDFDEVYLSLEKKLKEEAKIKFEYTYVRKGENNFTSAWPIKPWGPYDKFPEGSDFLWGNIEITNKILLRYMYSYKKVFTKIGLGYLTSRNWQNVASKTMKTILVSFTLQYSIR